MTPYVEKYFLRTRLGMHMQEAFALGILEALQDIVAALREKKP